jgi:hypothetical protein
MTPVSLVLTYFCIGVTLFEFFLHLDDNLTFAMKNLGFFVFNVVGYAATKYALKRVKIYTITSFKSWIIWLAEAGIAWILILIIQLFVGILIGGKRKISISSIEIYLFYVSAAISEENLIRGLCVTSCDMVAKAMKFNKVGKFFFITLTTSCIFTAAHYMVYSIGDTFFSQMALLAVFLAGLLLAAILLTTHNFFACLLAHILNNIQAASVTITNSILEPTELTEVISVIAFVILFMMASYIVYQIQGKFGWSGKK